MKIGIDIGGSHISVGLVNSEGKIIEKMEQDLDREGDVGKNILNYVDNAIEKLTQTVDITNIGVATPGNPKTAKMTNLVNLELNELDFKSIEIKYNISIKNINDAKAAAIAEKEYGALRGIKDGVFLCLGTGIGGAVFLNNELLISHRNQGFELGHMIIDKNGELCHCGKRGCFETYGSMKRLKDKLNISNEQELKILLEKEDTSKWANKIVQEYINDLIIGLSNVIDIFEPEVIVLGGSFVHFKETLFDKLVLEMNTRRYVFNKETLPKIKLAELGNDAGVIGATLI